MLNRFFKGWRKRRIFSTCEGVDARKVIPNHKEIMVLGGPQVAVNDDQPRSAAPNNDEKHTEDLLHHTVVMVAESPQEVGN